MLKGTPDNVYDFTEINSIVGNDPCVVPNRRSANPLGTTQGSFPTYIVTNKSRCSQLNDGFSKTKRIMF